MLDRAFAEKAVMDIETIVNDLWSIADGLEAKGIPVPSVLYRAAADLNDEIESLRSIAGPNP